MKLQEEKRINPLTIRLLNKHAKNLRLTTKGVNDREANNLMQKGLKLIYSAIELLEFGAE